ncbi:MAG: DUF885 family protein [Bacteroidia bacterium]
MKIALRHLPIIILLSTLLIAGIGIARFAWKHTHDFDPLAERIAVAMAENDPEMLSRIRPGFRDQAGNYSKQLSSYRNLRAKNAVLAEGFISEIDKIDTTRLDQSQKISRILIQKHLDIALREAAFSDYFFPVNPVDGPQVSLPALFSLHHEMLTEDEARNFLIRLRLVAPAIDEAIAASKIQEEKGIHLPGLLKVEVLKQVAAFLAIPPEKNPFYLGYARKLVHIAPTEMNEYDSSHLLEQASHVVTDDIIPAYVRLQQYLTALPSLPQQPPGVWHLPDGEKFYQLMREKAGINHTSPEILHTMALRSVDSLSQKIVGILGAEDRQSPGETLREWVENQPTACVEARLRYNPCLPAYQKLYRETQPLIGGLFETLPPMQKLSFIPAGEHDQTLAVSQQYFLAADSLEAGRIWISPALPELHRAAFLRTEVYSQLVPGKHFLHSYLLRQKGNFAFQLSHEYPAFTEGWALYADYLMEHDLNLYSGDREAYIAMLRNRLVSAAALATDTGIHYGKWSLSEAKKYLMEKAGLTDQESDEMLSLILSRPAFAGSGWVGFGEITATRMWAENILGNKFYLPEYHAALLSTGYAPIDVVILNIRHLVQLKLAS